MSNTAVCSSCFEFTKGTSFTYTVIKLDRFLFGKCRSRMKESANRHTWIRQYENISVINHIPGQVICVSTIGPGCGRFQLSDLSGLDYELGFG